MQALRFTTEQIVWQEVPNETSLAFLIAGCPLRCAGCHSADSWKAGSGRELSAEYLKGRLKRYQGLISCVLFLGGEWQPEALIDMLKIVQEAGLKSCLYTGLERAELEAVSDGIVPRLDYLKTGRWLSERGGLDQLTTNQKLINLSTGEVLNHRFIKTEPRKQIAIISHTTFQTA